MFVPRSLALSKSWKRCFGRLTGAKQAQHISTLSAWATTSSSFAKLVKCVAGAAGKAHALDGEFGAGPTTGALLQPFGKQQLGRTGAPCGIDNAAPRQEHASQVRAAAAGLRLCVEAKLRRRLLSYILSAPQRSERYFEASIWRRWMWAGISLCTGFYAGNILTLSFGALAVNDIFAGVICVMFYEVVTHLYYSTPNPGLRVWFANCFKIGLTASLLADAAKLGS
ncbi:hypothetical protein COHA_001240 [Chlorella ohadii]|uniref:Uncharacterized protein n=1 Tax=Chlorella ohadii TaxID=2649997 RepID=A0AAD5H622_9CHLO|nr:hypothetical protein COHA_001240 [Chlorella ohadii]